MRQTFYLFLSILLLSLSGFTQTAVQELKTAEGNQLQVRLTPLKEKIMLGETTYIMFEIKNLAGQDLDTGMGGDEINDIGRPHSYKVTIVRAGGKSVPQPKITVWGSVFSRLTKLPANGSYYKKLFLPHWATFEEPGVYLVTVEKSVEIFNRATRAKDSFQTKTSARIEIVPTDDAKLDEVIDSLATTMLDEELIWRKVDAFTYTPQEALILLDFIRDPRIIKYYAQMLEKYGRVLVLHRDLDLHLRNVARALSKYTDDLALETLKKMMKSLNEETRASVAEAFRGMKHPQALPLLLTMRADEYWRVRLSVLEAYGDRDSAEAQSVLQQMLKDENPMVRNRAQAYLNNRKGDRRPAKELQ